MSRRLTDSEAACNIIKRTRNYNRKNILHKAISVSLKGSLDILVSAVLICDFNIATGVYSVGAHCLRYKGYSIYPSKFRKLRCTNQRALDMLESSRFYSRVNSHNTFNFLETMDKNVELYEDIGFNYGNGEISVSSGFKSTHGKKLIFCYV